MEVVGLVCASVAGEVGGLVVGGVAVEGVAVEEEAVEGEAVEVEAVEGEAVEGEAVEGEAVEGEAIVDVDKVKGGGLVFASVVGEGDGLVVEGVVVGATVVVSSTRF